MHGYKLVVDHHFLGEEISTDGRLVLVAELLIHVLVHQRRLADARVAEDDHLQEDLLVGHIVAHSNFCLTKNSEKFLKAQIFF